LTSLLLKLNFQRISEGVKPETLTEIRGWEYGILLIQPHESFGTNTRFAKDSLVCITTPVESEAQYKQFLGRSSRGRGLCKGIYYPVSHLSAT
jgi:hypothetical protein